MGVGRFDNFEKLTSMGFRTLLPTIVTWSSLYCPSLNLNRPYKVKKVEKLNFLRFFQKKSEKKAEKSTFYQGCKTALQMQRRGREGREDA